MIDIIILAILAIGFWQGLRDGFVKSLCSFAGFFLGLLIAYLFYNMVGEKLAPHLGENAQAAPIVAFAIIWLAVPIALNFAGMLLTKFANALFLGGVNKLFGAAIGVVKYFLGATLVLYVLVLTNTISVETIDSSFFADNMIALAELLIDRLREVPAGEMMI